jgi:hypothetical protein
MRFSHLSALTISLLFGASHAATLDLVDRGTCTPYAGDCSFTACCAGLYCPYNSPVSITLSLSRRSSRGYVLKALQGMPQCRRKLWRCCTLLHWLVLLLDPQWQRSFSFSPTSASRTDGHPFSVLQGMPQIRRILRRCCTLLHWVLRLDPQRQRSFFFSPMSVSRTDGHPFSVLQVKEEAEGRVSLRMRYPPGFKYTP